MARAICTPSISHRGSAVAYKKYALDTKHNLAIAKMLREKHLLLEKWDTTIPLHSHIQDQLKAAQKKMPMLDYNIDTTETSPQPTLLAQYGKIFQYPFPDSRTKKSHPNLEIVTRNPHITCIISTQQQPAIPVLYKMFRTQPTRSPLC